MNKILIFPDIHGRTFWQSVDPKEYDLIIFLGDYVDPYSQEGITPEIALENLTNLVKFKELYPNTIFLTGNHDLPYINKEYASYFSYKDRFDYKNSETIAKLLNKLNLRLFYKYDKYLFSHAGINNRFDEHINHQLDDQIPTKDLAKVSFYRGGCDSFGSIIWSDIREHLNNTPNKYLSEYIQIFGHTQLNGAIHHNNWYCLDCKQPFELNLETGIICNAVTKAIPAEI